MSQLQQLASYRIEAALGSEPFADIYRAYDTVRRRPVRLKILRLDSLQPGASLGRILQEASQASELIHPHLAWVWETGEADGLYYLAERSVSGPTLAETLARAEPLSLEQVRQILQDLSQGLDFAHARGWSHGLISPQSVLLSPDLGAILTDFGLGRALYAIGQQLPALLPYTAPEVWQGDQPSPASDQYALGCLLAEMLCGKPLFAGPGVEETQIKQLDFNPGMLKEIPEIIWPYTAALERALHPNPAQRYPSAGAFASAPQQIADQAAPQERQRLQSEAEARLLMLEKERKAVEETARLAALEQARREIDEQVRRASEQFNLQQNQDAAGAAPPDGAQAALAPGPDEIASFIEKERPRRAAAIRTANRRDRQTLVWIGAVLVIVLILLGAWFASSSGPLSQTPTATASATLIPNTATLPATSSPTHLSSSTASPTASPQATFTPRPTRTPTASATPTITSSPTITATRTLQPTATRTLVFPDGPDTPTRTSLVARPP
jgi:serine/threonine protein kinase